MRGLGVLLCFLVTLLLSISSAFSQNKQVRIRNPYEGATSCGWYLVQSAEDTTTGEKVAELTRQSLDEFFAKNPDLGPRMAPIHSKTGRLLETEKDILAALESGSLEFKIVEPILFGVGVPISKKAQAAFKQDVLAASAGHAENPIHVRFISKPKLEKLDGPTWARPLTAVIEMGNYLRQELIYWFPMKSNDYQPPVAAERQSTKAKLWTSNTFQQLVITGQALFGSTISIASAVGGGIVNYGNSYVTGIYRKVIQNWMARANRSDPKSVFGKARNVVDQFSRNLLLSTFFTVEIFWLSKMFEWDKLAAIGTGAGWYHFLLTKWSSAFINVIWRFFYYEAIGKFETRMEEAGRKEDARRTASRFELVGTLLGTPGFLIASMADPKSGLIIPILGDINLQLTPAHGAMIAVGLLFAMFSTGILKMEPWVDRFDAIAAKISSAKELLGLKKRSKEIQEAVPQPALDPLKAEYNTETADIRRSVGMRLLEVLKIDARFRKVLDQRPDLKERLVQSDSLWNLFNQKLDLPVMASKMTP